MAAKVLVRRNNGPGHGLKQDLEAILHPGSPQPIPAPPNDVSIGLLGDQPRHDAITNNCYQTATLSSPTGGDSFTFKSFTAADAYELGHLLHARLLPLASTSPTLISISLGSGGSVLFQAAVGSGTTPDNEVWVRRKRAAVMRFGHSTWFLQCKYGGDENAFKARMGLSPEKAAEYAIHGGGVPIRVAGVEGVVAVVVVSGLKQDQDHAVIGSVITENWEYE